MAGEVTDEQLGLMLHAARDAALRMLEEHGGFVPFATRAGHDGAIELVSNHGAVRDDQLQDVVDRIRAALAEQAKQGGLLAAAIVSNVHVDDAGSGGFDRAIQVHVEAAGFSRVVLVPYRFPETGEVKLRRDVLTGTMLPYEAPPAIFAG